MRTMKLLFVGLLCLGFSSMQAQTAEEIVAKYVENIGGLENWNKIEGMQIDGKMKMQGMEIGLKVVALKDARQYTEINIQGQLLKQGVFDGTDMWGVNFMTGQPEKMDTEAVKAFASNEAKDFPDPLFNWKEKGYQLELLGNETMEGTECFKVKLTKNPVVMNGKETEVVSIYYFDTENFVPIAEEIVSGSMMQGPPGQEQQKMISTFSDYQEVDGLYISFSRTMPQGSMIIDKVTFNPEVDDSEFVMPEVVAAPKENEI